ncbi:MAG: hypothetical protein AB1629_03595 [Candidatus Omnitrophota bacterium]
MLRTRLRDYFGITLLIIIALFGVAAFKLISSGALDGLRLNFSNDLQDFKLQLGIIKENTRDLIVPPRKQPGSLLLAEEKLKQFLPDPFAKFGQGDWDSFWNLIYGVHETDDYGINYTPKRKRQLNIDEIEEILRQDYPHIFPKFDSQTWHDFWTLIFSKK